MNSGGQKADLDRLAVIASPTPLVPLEETNFPCLETLDRFVEVMHGIAETAATDPAAIRRAPVTTPVGRLDEAAAARRPDLRHRFPDPDHAGPSQGPPS